MSKHVDKHVCACVCVVLVLHVFYNVRLKFYYIKECNNLQENLIPKQIPKNYKTKNLQVTEKVGERVKSIKPRRKGVIFILTFSDWLNPI